MCAGGCAAVSGEAARFEVASEEAAAFEGVTVFSTGSPSSSSDDRRRNRCLLVCAGGCVAVSSEVTRFEGGGDEAAMGEVTDRVAAEDEAAVCEANRFESVGDEDATGRGAASWCVDESSLSSSDEIRMLSSI